MSAPPEIEVRIADTPVFVSAIVDIAIGFSKVDLLDEFERVLVPSENRNRLRWLRIRCPD